VKRYCCCLLFAAGRSVQKAVIQRHQQPNSRTRHWWKVDCFKF